MAKARTATRPRTAGSKKARAARAPARTPARAPKGAGAAAHAGRLARLRGLIASSGADGLLVTNPKDVGYLTGFLGGDSYLYVPAGSSGADPGGQAAVVISDFRYQEELEEVRRAGTARVHIRAQGMTEAVLEVVGGLLGGPGKLGVQAEHMSLALKRALEAGLGAGRVVETGGLVGKLRAVKDEHEIALIVKAARLQEEALLTVLEEVRPGQTELEIAAVLEAEMKMRGSDEPGFKTIVAAGAHGSLPHYRPGTSKVAANKPLLIDWGAVYQGYHADMTRTFAIGKWNRTMREIYQIVLEAQESAAAALGPGRTTHEIDAIARRHITRAGYGEQFGHGLGHGMGLDGHEDPRLNPMFAEAVLEVGNVVTVEPGIYLPGLGGVRIEDDYVITERGARNLCSLPKSMEFASR
ncbi:MAG TPA: M24 family metallopeptidase [Phycisphaerales bacterium]|nr:M24 family metallopeptidase [Phycisphaerales bacterium]